MVKNACQLPGYKYVRVVEAEKALVKTGGRYPIRKRTGSELDIDFCCCIRACSFRVNLFVSSHQRLDSYTPKLERVREQE